MRWLAFLLLALCCGPAWGQVGYGGYTAAPGSSGGLTIGATVGGSPVSGDVLCLSGSTLSQCSLGGGLSLTGSVLNTTFADTLHGSSATTSNIGSEDDYNGTGLTATLATLAAGQSLLVTAQNVARRA